MMLLSALTPLALTLANVPQAPLAGEGVVALKAAKALTCEYATNRAIDDAVLLVEGGLIVAIGRADEVEIPEGARVVDYGDRWLTPGFVDLHSHVGGSRGDINDMVYQLNSELRVSPAVIPANDDLHRPMAAVWSAASPSRPRSAAQSASGRGAQSSDAEPRPSRSGAGSPR